MKTKYFEVHKYDDKEIIFGIYLHAFKRYGIQNIQLIFCFWHWIIVVGRFK